MRSGLMKPVTFTLTRDGFNASWRTGFERFRSLCLLRGHFARHPNTPSYRGDGKTLRANVFYVTLKTGYRNRTYNLHSLSPRRESPGSAGRTVTGCSVRMDRWDLKCTVKGFGMTGIVGMAVASFFQSKRKEA